MTLSQLSKARKTKCGKPTSHVKSSKVGRRVQLLPRRCSLTKRPPSTLREPLKVSAHLSYALQALPSFPSTPSTSSQNALDMANNARGRSGSVQAGESTVSGVLSGEAAAIGVAGAASEEVMAGGATQEQRQRMEKRMMGPSDLKAGLGGKRSAEEVGQIIYEASKGTFCRYFLSPTLTLLRLLVGVLTTCRIALRLDVLQGPRTVCFLSFFPTSLFRRTLVDPFPSSLDYSGRTRSSTPSPTDSSRDSPTNRRKLEETRRRTSTGSLSS